MLSWVVRERWSWKCPFRTRNWVCRYSRLRKRHEAAGADRRRASHGGYGRGESHALLSRTLPGIEERAAGLFRSIGPTGEQRFVRILLPLYHTRSPSDQIGMSGPEELLDPPGDG